ncbi:MAG: succinate dehydrogenase [Rhodospirillales bacterium]|nr:succinate dehydrogenase [Rhodospirillales bacterium]
MSASALRIETYLWLAQRVSALILVICITVHIATMIIAVQGGLSSEEIIARIGGSKIWLSFYLVFVSSVAVHAPIGLKSIMREMSQIPTNRIDLLSILFSLIIGVLGIRAAFGLYGLGGA